MAEGNGEGQQVAASERRFAPWEWIAPIVAGLVLVVVAMVAGRQVAPSWSLGAALGGAGFGEATGEVVDPDVARVRGRVLLEQPSADGDTDGEPDATDGEPEVELVAPEPGTCTVIAWQQGKQVGGPTTCGDDGSFEVALGSGVFGRTAFEMLVPGRLRGVVEVEVPEAGLGRLPTVALGIGETIAGDVVDSRGEPVAGVQIQAMPTPNLEEPEPWRATSDEKGRFVFDTMPPGPATLRATKPGFLPSASEAIAPVDDVLIVLEGLSTLKGKVHGGAELLARATVRLEGSHVWPAAVRAVAPDGLFAFPDIPDGVYGLEAVVLSETPDGPEYASIPLENVTPDMFASLALTEAFRVPVRVVDPNQNPIPEAHVTMGYATVGMLQRVAETGPDGKVRAGPVVPGPYVIQADADGFLPADPIQVNVPADGKVEEQTLVLAKPARIEGIVVDDADRPVAGATVSVDSDVIYSAGEGTDRALVFESTLKAVGTLGVTVGPVPEIPLFPEDEDEPIVGAKSDADGRFVIDMLAPGLYRLRATHGLHAASREVAVKLRSGQVRTGVKLVVREGWLLSGRILDGNRRPVRGAQVELEDGTVLITDGRGVFDAGYRRGYHRLVVRAPGMTPREAEIHLEGEPLDVELLLEPATGVFEGRVRDGNQRPIEDVQVTLRMLDGLSPTVIAWTDRRGIYSFERLALGRAEVQVDHPEYVSTQRSAEVGERPDLLELELERGWTVEVTVRSDRRSPIAGARVEVKDVVKRSGKQGTAVLTRISGRRAQLRVSAPGFVTHNESLTRDATMRTEVRVELTEGGSMEGRIIDDIGSPVRGARVLVLDLRGGVLGEARSRAGGTWAVDSLPEGDVVVRAVPPKRSDAVLAPVELRSDVLRGRVTRGVDLRFDRHQPPD